ncbi:MAG: hypothetical protein WBA74_03255 [Cyclobacteriaceae bacterium]
MKNLLIILSLLSGQLMAQSKKVTETVAVDKENKVHLEFTFANNIAFLTWDKNEIKVEVDVEINKGKYNDIFSLSSSKLGDDIFIEMDKEMWKKADSDCQNFNSTIDYTVYLPKNMEIRANTISGNYEFVYFGSPVYLKTISGVIDMTVDKDHEMDFRANTISGEIFSDIDISFPEGKDGLNQIVGQKIKGRIRNGGQESTFETISGNIFLRKG